MEDVKANAHKTLEKGQILKEEKNGDWLITTKDGCYIKMKKDDWLLVYRHDASGEIEHHCLSDSTKSYISGAIYTPDCRVPIEYVKRMNL